LPKNVGIIYRNYESEINSQQISEIKNFCRKLGKKIYLANNVKLAIKNNLDGAYIPSFDKNLIYKVISKKRKFLIMGSAHRIDEIKIKEKQGVDLIFLSPLFLTKNYQKNLGIIKFNLLSKISKKPIIALGGIRKYNLKKIKLIKAIGFSGITFFNS